MGEGIVRILSVMLNRYPIVVSNSHAGWANKPNLRNKTVIFGGSEFTISTDRDGHRITYPIDQPPPAKAPVMLVVGDSFAQGIGVNDNHTFAWMLARRSEYHVVNLGVVGYGTDQELASLEEFLAKKPDSKVSHIVVLVFDNDFTDVQRSYDPYLGRSKPRFRTVKRALDQTRYKPTFADNLMDLSRLFWLVNSKSALMLANPNPSAEDGVDVVLACLRAMQRLAESQGAQIHIFAYHRLTGPPFSISRWKSFLDQSNAIDITPRLIASHRPDLVGSDDVHWSIAGNELVADALLDFLNEEQVATTTNPRTEY